MIAIAFLFVGLAGTVPVALGVTAAVVSCPLPALQQANAGRGAGGSQLGPDQTQNAQAILGQVKAQNLPPQAAVDAVAAALAESGLQNLPNGDRDSVGLFQQRPSQGWGTPQQIQNPAYATQKFLSALQQVPNWASQSVEGVDQAVQKSGNPAAYAQFQAEAQQLVQQLWSGSQPGQSSQGQPTGGFMCEFQARPAPQGQPQPREIPKGGLTFPIPQTIPPTGWKLPIPVPSFPPGLTGGRVNPPQISPQCVAGALWAWAAVHLSDPAFAHPPALAVPSAYQMTAAAQQEHFRLDSGPTVGDMVVFRNGSFYGPNGHVGLVISTAGDKYLVAEQNFMNETSDLGAHWGSWDIRSLAWPDANVSGFIASPPA